MHRNAATPGLERYVLALALLVPMALMVTAASQLAGISLNAATVNDTPALVTRRPAQAQTAPPPTLTAPTPLPRPTPTAVPTPVPQERTYTVQPGDELKRIAADYNISIWRIIDTNDIPNPDSLRVGQVLHIPEN